MSWTSPLVQVARAGAASPTVFRTPALSARGPQSESPPGARRRARADLADAHAAALPGMLGSGAGGAALPSGVGWLEESVASDRRGTRTVGRLPAAPRSPASGSTGAMGRGGRIRRTGVSRRVSGPGHPDDGLGALDVLASSWRTPVQRTALRRHSTAATPSFGTVAGAVRACRAPLAAGSVPGKGRGPRRAYAKAVETDVHGPGARSGPRLGAMAVSRATTAGSRIRPAHGGRRERLRPVAREDYPYEEALRTRQRGRRRPCTAPPGSSSPSAPAPPPTGSGPPPPDGRLGPPGPAGGGAAETRQADPSAGGDSRADRRRHSNQEIADDLFVSPKTVEHHVSAILGELSSPPCRGSRHRADVGSSGRT